MKRSLILASMTLAALVAACDDPGPPPPTPDRYFPATTASAASSSSAAPATSETGSTTDAAPVTSATAEPAPSTSAVEVASAAPSGSASAAPTVKGFSFPSPKSGIVTAAEADKILPAGSAKVRVLDPGTGTLEKAFYAASKGDSQGLRFEFGMKLGITTPGQPAPTVLVPPQAVDLDVTTDSFDESSGAALTMVLRSITMLAKDGVDQDTADTLTKQLTGLRGYTVREKVSTHGASSELKTELPAAFPKGAEQLLSNMNAAFRAMIPRLPEEAIGTGAKWQVLSRDEDSGTSLLQLHEYTLKERSGSKLTISYSGRQLAASDVVKLPTGMPEGMTTRLVKFSTSVSGSMVVDTKQMAPIKGRSAQDSKLSIDVSAPGQLSGVKADVDMKMSVSIARRAGGAASPASAPSGSASVAPAPAPTADKGAKP